VITGAQRRLRRRCKELDITYVYEKQDNKIAATKMFCEKPGERSEVAFLGDDLPI